MSETVILRYGGVRYSPIHSDQYPFQVVATAAGFVSFAVVEMTLEQAKDLHNSLAMMIKGADSV